MASHESAGFAKHIRDSPFRVQVKRRLHDLQYLLILHALSA